MSLFGVINKVHVMGNLTRDPDLKEIGSNNTKLCEIALALNSRKKKGDKWEDVATFVDIKCWGKIAEWVMKYGSKGAMVYIEGHLEQETWEKDGQRRSRLLLIADDVTFPEARNRK